MRILSPTALAEGYIDFILVLIGGDIVQFNDHQEKYKYEDIRGIHGEQFRNLPKYKNYVDSERTHLNRIHVFNPELDSDNWGKRIRDCRAIHQETTGKSLRKDAVVFISDVATVPKEWPVETTLQYFEERNIFMEQFLSEHGVKKEYLLSSVVHMDETEPHQTIVYMPFKEGKFQAKNITNKIMLRQLQSKGWEFYKDFESRHPEISDYKLQPYEEGGSDSKRKKKHLDELSYKNKKEEEKLEKVKEKILQKEEKLEKLEEKIINNPVTKLADDSEIVEEIVAIKEDLKQFNTDTKLNNELEVEQIIPTYDNSDWLEKNVTYIEAKKDLFGNEKKPAHIEIGLEEWERKKQIKESNDYSFSTLNSIYKGIKQKYKKLKGNTRRKVEQAEMKLNRLLNGFDFILKLPVSFKWNEIARNRKRIDTLELNKVEQNEIIEDLQSQVNESNWFRDFYNSALKVLFNSTDRNGNNSLDSLLSNYDEKTQELIVDDFEKLINKKTQEKLER